ncbi:GNAT family N-acetyltransferase [Paenibacillus illinoisensis]|uniref:GNAT family N-acetyltransferase n=1 Tax=Paenibacillus illinoisensis TaxID=59845 RepID=UPI001C8D7B9D|nr:GNAT family N-acetyltransferase [Paenibacillus illinoisensis]MBY0217910.1 GNAT family N-acetyltransferase [Paenibacillus illinoisensis]
MLNWDDISREYQSEIENFQMLNTPDERNVRAFLQNCALELHERQTAVTRLYFDQEDKLVGFFSLHNDLVKVSPSLILEHRWNLITEGLTHFPAIKLHYLGVDARYRKQGVGKYLMEEVRSIAKEISNYSGCNFITVEALHSSLTFYRDRGFKLKDSTAEFHNMLFSLETLDNPTLEATPLISKQKIQEIRDKVMSVIEQSNLTYAQVAATSGLDEIVIEQMEFGTDVDVETLASVCQSLGIRFL